VQASDVTGQRRHSTTTTAAAVDDARRNGATTTAVRYRAHLPDHDDDVAPSSPVELCDVAVLKITDATTTSVAATPSTVLTEVCDTDSRRRLRTIKARSHHHARHDKTVLSVSRPLRRCDMDSRQLKTVAGRKCEV